MDINKLTEKIVTDSYMAIFYVDAKEENCEGAIFSDILKGFPLYCSYREHLQLFMKKIITKEDRDLYHDTFSYWIFPDETANTDRTSIQVRINDENKIIRYIRVGAVAIDSSEKKFILTYYDETPQIEQRMAELRALKLNNTGIQFLVQHMCEDFLIANIATDESMMYTPNTGNMEIKASFKEQIDWFANNIVAPKERESYLQYFEMDTLVEHIRENDGFCKMDCTVIYADGVHDFVVATALVTDPTDLKTEYIFAIAQDMTILRKAQEKGTHDALTRLLNRSAAEIEIAKHLQSSNSEPCLMLLFDVDFFKQINDNYGHLAGDDVLRQVGNTMRNIFSNDCILARWGGDEFLALIKDRKEEYKIVEFTDALKNFYYNDAPIPITLSIGVITAREETDFTQLFQQADDAMYLAKRNGRNRLVWG